MKKSRTATQIEITGSLTSGTLVGRIIEINESGQVLVDYSGNSSGILAARMTSSARDKMRQCDFTGREVLLSFEKNDPRLPIIVDTMHNLLDDIAENSTAAPDEFRDESINGKRVVLDAHDEIVLRCGKSSITLTKTGKVLIEGEYVLSSSKGANKIKGSSIDLN